VREAHAQCILLDDSSPFLPHGSSVYPLCRGAPFTLRHLWAQEAKDQELASHSMQNSRHAGYQCLRPMSTSHMRYTHVCARGAPGAGAKIVCTQQKFSVKDTYVPFGIDVEPDDCSNTLFFFNKICCPQEQVVWFNMIRSRKELSDNI